MRACAAGVVLSVGSSVCLSTPSHNFEQNELVYGLYLLLMSQKLTTVSLHLPHEQVRASGRREKQTFNLFWGCQNYLLTFSTFNDNDYYTTSQVHCNNVGNLISYQLMALLASYSSEMNKC